MGDEVHDFLRPVEFQRPELEIAPLEGDLSLKGDVSAVVGAVPFRNEVRDDFCARSREAFSSVSFGALEHALGDCEAWPGVPVEPMPDGGVPGEDAGTVEEDGGTGPGSGDGGTGGGQTDAGGGEPGVGGPDGSVPGDELPPVGSGCGCAGGGAGLFGAVPLLLVGALRWRRQ